MKLLSVPVAVFLCLILLVDASSAQDFAVVNVSVITMESPSILKEQTVLISKGRISRIGKSSSLKVPKGFVQVDGKGRYLMPGLADMHVHLQSPIDLTEFLVNGVTTVFDLNGKPAYLRWRKRIETGEMVGPQLFLCGPYFRDPEPVDDAVRRVDEIAATGYDGIKIKNNVTREEFDAIVAEAKKKKLLLLGHTPRLPGFHHALEAGLNLAHEEEILYGAFSPDGIHGNVEHGPEKVKRVVEEVRASGTFLIPTLVMYDAIYRQATGFEDFARRPEFAYLSSWQRDRFDSQNPYKDSPKDDQDEFRENLAFMKSVLTPALQKAGVKMLAGTDAEGLGTLAGFSLVEELEELHQSGLTNYEALQTATSYPALFVHREERFGKVRAGMRADLVLLNQDPLADLGHLRDLAGVFVGVKWLGTPELAQMRRDIPKNFATQLETARRLIEDGATEQALTFLEFNDPYERMGAHILQTMLAQDGFPRFRNWVESVRPKHPSTSLTSESAINSLGYALLTRRKLDVAIQVFDWNAQEFPLSANAEDSLADAYRTKTDFALAVVAYQKALAINPNYGNAGFARRFIQEHR